MAVDSETSGMREPVPALSRARSSSRVDAYRAGCVNVADAVRQAAAFGEPEVAGAVLLVAAVGAPADLPSAGMPALAPAGSIDRLAVPAAELAKPDRARSRRNPCPRGGSIADTIRARVSGARAAFPGAGMLTAAWMK
jgi:hypothetical protein